MSNLQKPTPRVEAVIAEAMKKHPGELKKWKALAVAAEQVSEAAIQRKERAERLGLPHNAEITGG